MYIQLIDNKREMKIVWSEAKAIKIAIEHPDREYTFEQVAEAIIS